jgi:hypothetical protein
MLYALCAVPYAPYAVWLEPKAVHRFRLVFLFHSISYELLAMCSLALCPMPFALCSLPSALCPLPSALCSLPSALCPLLYALCPFRLPHSDF